MTQKTTISVAERVTARLDEIHAGRATALREPDSVWKFLQLKVLADREAACWRELFEATSSRLLWLAALAAEQNANRWVGVWQGKAAQQGLVVRKTPAASSHQLVAS